MVLIKKFYLMDELLTKILDIGLLGFAKLRIRSAF